jgi:hypothetical protein
MKKLFFSLALIVALGLLLSSTALGQETKWFRLYHAESERGITYCNTQDSAIKISDFGAEAEVKMDGKKAKETIHTFRMHCSWGPMVSVYYLSHKHATVFEDGGKANVYKAVGTANGEDWRVIFVITDWQHIDESI